MAPVITVSDCLNSIMGVLPGGVARQAIGQTGRNRLARCAQCNEYGMHDGQLLIETRGALVQYVLQRYQIDTTKVHAKATAQQIVVANLDELQPWLYH